MWPGAATKSSCGLGVAQGDGVLDQGGAGDDVGHPVLAACHQVGGVLALQGAVYQGEGSLRNDHLQQQVGVVSGYLDAQRIVEVSKNCPSLPATDGRRMLPLPPCSEAPSPEVEMAEMGPP